MRNIPKTSDLSKEDAEKLEAFRRQRLIDPAVIREVMKETVKEVREESARQANAAREQGAREEAFEPEGLGEDDISPEQ